MASGWPTTWRRCSAAARRQNALLAAGLSRRRVDASFGHRVEAAVLQMVRAADPVDWIAAELAHALGLDSAAICFDDARPEGRLCDARTGRSVR